MKTANDAAVILYEIAAKIRSLEGMPVDYGLALELSSVLNRIESSVDSPSSASAPSGEIDPQCESIDNSYRCELYRGHDGKHLNREIEINQKHANKRTGNLYDH